MKKQSTLALLSFALLVVFYALSCQKQTGPSGASLAAPDSNEALIRQARQYYDLQHYSDSISQPGDTLPMNRTSLHKTPLWEQAQVQTFSFGKGVVVPVYIAEGLSVQVSPGQAPVPARQITWLFLYHAMGAPWHAEVVTRIPSSTSAGTFQGKVRVEDWQGNFLKAYLYSGGKATRLSLSTTYRRDIAARPNQGTVEAADPDECTETDWYACSSVGGVDMGCDYEYTTEECTGGGADDGDDNEGAAPGSGDYSAIGGGGTGSTNGNASTLSKITPDTSITNNPIVNCVYTHLMSPQLVDGLYSVLAPFTNSQIYNLTFTLGDVPGDDGQCSYKGNNTFIITLSAGEADDPDYSRIWLASTFIHEAFHAKLRQKALATFGEAAINQWPTPIDDMDLSELASCFEAESKTANIWESVEHDWMVDNVTQMATCLQNFVQTFYPGTYAQVGSNLAPYTALMYMGLQNSTLYQEQVVATGQEAAVEAWWPKLNEGGKCSD